MRWLLRQRRGQHGKNLALSDPILSPAEEVMTTRDEGFIRSVKDITAGSVGGIAQVLTGQPFDIVKVFSSTFTLG